MNFAVAFDVAMGLLAVTFMVKGLLRGLSGEFFSLLGVLGGVFLSWKYSGVVAEWMGRFWKTGNPMALSITAMIVLYAAAVLAAALLCRMVKAFLKFTSLTFADRVLGVAAGGFKVAVLVLFLYAAFTAFSHTIPAEWMSGSVVMGCAEKSWPYARTVLEKFGLLPEMGLEQLFVPGGEPAEDEAKGSDGI